MLDFPSSPVEGQSHFDEGQLWTFTDGAWIVGTLTSELTEIVDGSMPDATSGWVVYGDVLVQWGQSVTDGAGSATVIFPQEFKDGTGPSVTVSSFADGNVEFTRRASTPPVADRHIWFAAYSYNSAGTLTGNEFFNWVAMGEAPDDLKKTKHVLGGNGELHPQVMVEDDTAQGWLVIGDVLYCWGAFSTDGSGVGAVTYPQAFDSNPAVSCSGINAVGTARIFTITSPTPTGFTGVCQDTAAQGASRSAYWTAFGPAPDALKKPKSLIGGTGQIAVQDVSDGNTDSGYYIVGDMLIQWGTAQSNGAGTGVATYPVSFKSGKSPRVSGVVMRQPGGGQPPYVVMGGGGSAGTGGWSFDVRNGSGAAVANTDIDWIAVGEVPDDMKTSKSVLGGTVGDVARVSEGGDGYLIVGKKLICWGVAQTDANGEAVFTYPHEFAVNPIVTATPVGNANWTVSQKANSATETTVLAFAAHANTTAGAGLQVLFHAIGEVPDADALPEHVVGKGVMEYHDPTGASSWRIIGETLECWGVIDAPIGNPTSVTFPKTFAASPTITTTVLTSDEVNSRFAYATNRSTTGFDVIRTSNGAAAGHFANWHAIGKWDGVS